MLYEKDFCMTEKKKIDLETVKHIASLAYLKLTAEEEEKYSSQLGDILLYMEKLNRLDTGDVPGTYHPVSPADISNVFRDDADTGQSISKEDALRNAPLSGRGFFKVPKIISSD
jgi:aspartyl-tRNA(Asn)/glutamyl-tRNA(Gln) amidotransferase subunit C